MEKTSMNICIVEPGLFRSH